MTYVNSFSIGSAKIEYLQVATTDLNALSRATGIKLDGIVGYNYLKNFRLILDFATEILILQSSESNTDKDS